MNRVKGVKLEGDFKLIRALKRMKLKRAGVLKAMRPAAKLYQDAARDEAPEKSGQLRRSIRIKTLRGNPPTLVVRPEYRARQNKFGTTTSAGFHAHLVEYGTKLRPAVKGKPGASRIAPIAGGVVITNTGSMRANPFQKRAFDKTENPMHRQIRVGLWDVVKTTAKEVRD